MPTSELDTGISIPRLLTLAAVAEALAVSPHTVRMWVPDAMIALEATEILLQDILNEETLEFFTGETGPLPDQAGRRLLAIGRLLYDRPRDCLQISLWELLAAMYPDVWRNGASPESLFRPGAWALSESVTMETTWDEFEAAVRRMCEPISSSALHIVPSSD